MKHVWVCDNGEVEFNSQEDFERYLRGEKPTLELIDGTKYKAIYEKSDTINN